MLPNLLAGALMFLGILTVARHLMRWTDALPRNPIPFDLFGDAPHVSPAALSALGRHSLPGPESPPLGAGDFVRTSHDTRNSAGAPHDHVR